MLLLHLCSPALAADRHPESHPAVAQHDEPADAAREGVAEPRPGGDGASLHRPLARSPRAPGAAGTAHPTAGTPTPSTAPRRSAPHPYPAGPPQGRGPGDPALRATDLQTFRC
ncbi:hypothetical protein GCM10010340_30100 [Streptomyces griseoloalbus]|nr:hypothetical protein GCM10010340_30100 [Streptomyces albaduncus]